MTGRLRIISGCWRGRRLAVPDRPGLRPTGDRARETLFNWLQDRVRGARCADLFAGSGALGLEAASRGAQSAVLVERDRRAVETVREGIAGWPDGDAVRIVHGDALRWLENADGPLDLVFVDPPFDAGLHAPVLQALQRPGLLAEDARVYVESPARATAPIREDDLHWRVLRDKKVGDVRMQLLAPPAAEPGLPPLPGA